MRRVLADSIGLVTLMALAGIAIALVPGIDRAIQDWPITAGALLVLVIVSYFFWIELETKANDGRKVWPMGALGTVAIGFVFLLIDFVLGRLIHPELGFIRSTVSNHTFFATVFFCPVCTFACLSGWARSAVLRRPAA
jgi:hypothetical protein